MVDKKFPCVVSFYTIETLYQVEVQNLIASCRHFDLKHHVVGVPSAGSWELNCAYKPFFLAQVLEELNEPILWVDADAVFVQAPKWLDVFDRDFAAWIDPDLPDSHDSKVASGTLFIQPTKAAKEILKQWQQETSYLLLEPNRTAEFWDQISLRNALLKNKTAVIGPLPLEYIKIFDHPLHLQKVLNPVVVHYQASRRLKNRV